MQIPLVDVVLLSLLLLFFGVEQRRRPELYFRFWLTGWVLVLCSIVLSEFTLRYATAELVRQCLQADLLVCGGIAFIFSSVIAVRKGERVRAAVVRALLIALPVCFGLDLLMSGTVPVTLLVSLIVVSEGITFSVSFHYLSRRNGWTLPALAALCLLNGAILIFFAIHGRQGPMMNFVLAQVFLTAGLLFGRGETRAGRWAGSMGFLLWGASYLLESELVRSPAVLHVVNAVGTVPKYLVGFGMILRIFAEANTEIGRLGARHRELYEEYRVLFKSNPHPMWMYDVHTERFLAVNDAAVAEYRFSEAQFLRMRVSDLVVEPELPGKAMELEGEGGSPRDAAVRHRRADGSVFDVHLTDHDILFEGHEARFVLAMDITEREALHRDLIHRAHHDVLTGLPNRVMLDDRLSQWLTRCEREETMGAMLTVDIDHFKRVNDTYGHLVGDECLKVTAERLRSRVRQVDTIARTGGEEFTIVVGSLKNREGAQKVCEVLLQLFEKPVVLPGCELPVTISIGVALYPEDGLDIDTLRRASDRALYAAKRAGRRRAVFAAQAREMPPDPEPTGLPGAVEAAGESLRLHGTGGS